MLLLLLLLLLLLRRRHAELLRRKLSLLLRSLEDLWSMLEVVRWRLRVRVSGRPPGNHYPGGNDRRGRTGEARANHRVGRPGESAGKEGLRLRPLAGVRARRGLHG